MTTITYSQHQSLNHFFLSIQSREILHTIRINFKRFSSQLEKVIAGSETLNTNAPATFYLY